MCQDQREARGSEDQLESLVVKAVWGPRGSEETEDQWAFRDLQDHQ